MEINIPGIAIIVAFVAWNLITFLVYGADKAKAKKDKRRISEKALILVALIMGGLGALLGMVVFRHKTNKLKFTIGVPVCLLVNIGVIAVLIHFNILTF